MRKDSGEWKFAYADGRTQSLATDHPISSIIELLLRTRVNPVGKTLEFYNTCGGLLICTAGSGVSTLAFDPAYDNANHTTSGLHNAIQEEASDAPELVFEDDTSTLSSIPSRYALPLFDVIRGVVYILETHEYPDFLRWG